MKNRTIKVLFEFNIFILISVVLLFSCTSKTSNNIAKKPKPNIIFILADDFGRELLSVYGGRSYDTPVLDRMSDKGLTFTDTYATPMCAPTRMMFLTGQYNFRNYDDWDEMNYDIKTIGHHMQEAGYVTGMTGKWHRGGWDLSPKGPEKAGFAEYSSFDYTIFHQNAFWGIDIWQNNELIRLEEGESSSEHFNNFVINFIKNNKDHPFFFYYAMNLVHRPFLPTPINEKIDEPSVQDKLSRNRGELEYFPENVSYLDELVGRIITVLKEKGLMENTILIFTSDNGTDNVNEASELYSEFKDSFYPESSTRRVKGGKYFPNELGVNVPFLVYAPGFIQESRIVSKPIDFTDMLPTFYDLAGESVDSLETDGLSLAPLIKDEEYEGREWIYSYGNYDHNSSKYKDPVNNADGFYHVISNGQWKYYSDGRLYKVVEDILEENEISIGYSIESDSIRSYLNDELDKLRSSEPKLW